MLRAIPLLIVPLLAYVIAATVVTDALTMKALLNREFISIEAFGGSFSLVVSDVFIAAVVALVIAEIGKSTRTSPGALVENAVALITFAAAMVLLFAYESFTTIAFMTLTCALLIDALMGFAAMIAAARRHRKQLKRARTASDPDAKN